MSRGAPKISTIDSPDPTAEPFSETKIGPEQIEPSDIFAL